MSSLLSDKPTNAFQSLFDLMKSLPDTNREMHDSPIEQRDLLRWRRDALEELTEPWKGATRLAGRQRFEREIRVLRRRFTDGEIRHVLDLPTVPTMLGWMGTQPGRVYDVVKDRVQERSLARGLTAQVTHRSALLHGTTKAAWEAKRARKAWGEF